MAIEIPAPNADIRRSRTLPLHTLQPTKFTESLASSTAPSLAVNPSPHHPSNLTPGTSIESIPNRQNASPKVAGAQYCSAQSHPMNLTPITADLKKTLAADGSLYNLLTHHEQNQTLDSSILCVANHEKAPATAMDPHFFPSPLCQKYSDPRPHHQYTFTSEHQKATNSYKTPSIADVQSISTTTPQKNLISPSQHSHGFASDPQLTLPSKCVTFWTSCTRCRMLHEFQDIFRNQKLLCRCCGMHFVAIEIPAPNAEIHSSRSLPLYNLELTKFTASSHSRSVLASSRRNAQSSGRKRTLGNLKVNSVGNRGFSSKSGLPSRVKELSRADICSMLMEKARTEIIL